MHLRRHGIRLIAASGALVVLAGAPALAETATGIGDASSVETSSTTPQARTTAQQAETGIGEADAIECTGTVAVSVVDLDGAPVSGSVLNVAGTMVTGDGAVTATCGEVAASLLTAPDGYAAAGPTTATARVTNGATEPVVFQVDEVEVPGVTLDADDEAQAAPETPTADPQVDTDEPPTLPATGPQDALRLLLGALLTIGLGLAWLTVGSALGPRGGRRSV